MTRMWHIASTSDRTRWVQYDQGTITGDDETVAGITTMAGQPVEYAPMASTYTPTSQADPIGLYLLGRMLLPGPLTVTGIPPAMADVPTGYVAGIPN